MVCICQIQFYTSAAFCEYRQKHSSIFVLPNESTFLPSKESANAPGPEFSGPGALKRHSTFKAAPHNLASRFGERFFVKSRFEKRRNTVCISSFSNCGIGGKDPPKCADTIVRCCPITMIIVFGMWGVKRIEKRNRKPYNDDKRTHRSSA